MIKINPDMLAFYKDLEKNKTNTAPIIGNHINKLNKGKCANIIPLFLNNHPN